MTNRQIILEEVEVLKRMKAKGYTDAYLIDYIKKFGAILREEVKLKMLTGANMEPRLEPKPIDYCEKHDTVDCEQCRGQHGDDLTDQARDEQLF